MIQSVVEIYHSMASLPSFSKSNSFITCTKLCFFFLHGKVPKKMGLFKRMSIKVNFTGGNVADGWPGGFCQK